MGREYFVTVGDAAEVLPEARRRVAAVATLERQAVVAPGLAARKALEARIHEALEWFDGEAVVVRETSPAVLDFNVLAGGRLVQLCWREGEDTFEAWHETIRNYYRTLWPILEAAVDNDLIPKNPASRVELPPIRPGHPSLLHRRPGQRPRVVVPRPLGRPPVRAGLGRAAVG